jgi:hypothetical protein
MQSAPAAGVIFDFFKLGGLLVAFYQFNVNSGEQRGEYSCNDARQRPGKTVQAGTAVVVACGNPGGVRISL